MCNRNRDMGLLSSVSRFYVTAGKRAPSDTSRWGTLGTVSAVRTTRRSCVGEPALPGSRVPLVLDGNGHSQICKCPGPKRGMFTRIACPRPIWLLGLLPHLSSQP